MDTVTSPDVTASQAVIPQRCVTWTEAVWLERLETAVDGVRRANSQIAALLSTMLVALGWLGTARSLAALLPPLDVPMTLGHVELLLPAIGFRSRRVLATGTAADTCGLRAGSLAQRRDGEVGVYLGHPDGEDLWFVNGSQCQLPLAKGDTILSVEPDADFHPIDEPRPNWFRRLFEQVRDALFGLFAMSLVVNLVALTVSLYVLAVYGLVIPSGVTTTIWHRATGRRRDTRRLGAQGRTPDRQLAIGKLGRDAHRHCSDAQDDGAAARGVDEIRHPEQHRPLP